MIIDSAVPGGRYAANRHLGLIAVRMLAFRLAKRATSLSMAERYCVDDYYQYY
jgi:hypothetical protein